MEPDDYERWGRAWRRTLRAAAVAASALVVGAAGFALLALLR
jgi:hypothetical protein